MKPTDPKFVIKLPPKEVEALETWLDQARELDAHLHRGSAELRGLETKLAKAQAEAEKLRPKADEESVAGRLSMLETQIAALDAKVAAAYSNAAANDTAEFTAVKLVLSELRPVLTKAMQPLLTAEAERLATPLFPYFRHRAGALAVVGQSDWMRFLQGIYLSEYRHQSRLDGAIHVVASVLRSELPVAYDPNPET